MNTFGVPTTCKFCKKPIVLRIGSECPPEMYEGLIPMAACNRCGDRIEKRNKAMEGIQKCCRLILKKKEGKPPGWVLPKETFDAAMQTLSVLTRHISEVVADAHDASTIVWSDEFPRMLIDAPEQWDTLVRGFRHRAAAWHREQQAGVHI